MVPRPCPDLLLALERKLVAAGAGDDEVGHGVGGGLHRWCLGIGWRTY